MGLPKAYFAHSALINGRWNKLVLYMPDAVGLIVFVCADRNKAVHAGEIRKLSDEIAMLNERVESLSKSVSTMEGQFTHVIALTDSITIVETNRAASSPTQIPEPGNVNSTFDMSDSNASSVVDNAPETGDMPPRSISASRL